MTTELQQKAREPSQVLTNLINEANSSYGRAKELIVEAYHQAKREGYTPQEAKGLLLQHCTIFGKTTIFNYLPDECKNQTKAGAGRVSHKKSVSVPDLEQNSEVQSEGMGVVITPEEESHSESASSTGSEGQEIEVEESHTDTAELLSIIADKDKALEEERRRRKAAEARNPQNIPDLDARMQITKQNEEIQKLLAENDLLRKNQKPAEFVKASEIPPSIEPKQAIRPFILNKEVIPSLIADLNHSLNNDVKCFLCEDSWLYWFTGYQSSSYISQVKRELSQRFEVLSQLNAS